jgi:hypothetical protein
MIWKVFTRLPSKRDDAEDYANECYRKGVIAIGWNEVGNLNKVPSMEVLRKRMVHHFGDTAENGARTVGQWAGILWTFRNQVKPGHYVICPDSDSKRYYVGIVRSGKTFFDETPIGGKCNFAHRRRVKWIRVLSEREIKQIWPKGRFGGNQTLGEIRKGAVSFMAFLKRPHSKKIGGRRLPCRPDMEWGKKAEARAMEWLASRGYSPKDVSHLNLGWDISCDDLKYEIKGRKSLSSMVRLSQNEWLSAKKYKKKYTVLIFTAPNEKMLHQASPAQIPNPTQNKGDWTVRCIYEYILNE